MVVENWWVLSGAELTDGWVGVVDGSVTCENHDTWMNEIENAF
jgi:hypothetical protein